ncbi:MAG: hypothetical protein ABWZ74_09520 [Hyphomicrobiaceae bacterium]|jgi:hypothetical protein
MRRVMVVLGLVLLLAAAGTFGYRWFHEPGRYAGRQHTSPGGWRGVSEPRSGGWRDNRSEPSSGRGGGVSGLRLFEIVVDLLNIVVGVGGIWLAIIGVRMQRAANRRMPLRTDT